MGCWEGDLKNPGDYVVTDLKGESIVLTRDEDGGVNAFYNVCSHRGNQIAYGACGNTQTFRCSYHLWEYNLKGRADHGSRSGNVPAGRAVRKAVDPPARVRNVGRLRLVQHEPRCGTARATISA